MSKIRHTLQLLHRGNLSTRQIGAPVPSPRLDQPVKLQLDNSVKLTIKKLSKIDIYILSNSSTSKPKDVWLKCFTPSILYTISKINRNFLYLTDVAFIILPAP